jgi:UDP-N-acetylmuramoyl-tripeptide--D-alanyl-D-alanine ligase
MYGPAAAARLVAIYRKAGGPFTYLGSYWTTQSFIAYGPDRHTSYRAVRLLIGLGMLAQLIVGLSLLYADVRYGYTAAGYFGAALVISYPIIWAHVLFLLSLCWKFSHPKQYGKALLCMVFEQQVLRLRAQNDFTLVAVAGSVGKTSTKLAIAQLLSESKRVRYQEGNYNDRLTVPLVLFNTRQPGLYNLLAWLRIYLRNRKKLRQPYPFDVAVVELGTDGPGQMKDFAYLRPDITVLTAVSEEHIEQFKTLEAVAEEELTVFKYSKQVLVNTDDVADTYLRHYSCVSYGIEGKPTYHAKLSGKPTAKGQKITMTLDGKKATIQSKYFGAQGAKIILAASAIATMMGVDSNSIKSGAAGLQPFAGRMQVLAGIKNSTLLDDTYNASPLAVRAALDVLYGMDSTQRIAVLGSMNELGPVSKEAHTSIGTYCDSKKLKLVVTIGPDANKYLAPAAKKAGCKVKTFDNPKKAGDYVAKQLKNRATVLVKGSQNKVFAEEALKPLLKDPDDVVKLVRQTGYWMRIKRSQFGA